MTPAAGERSKSVRGDNTVKEFIGYEGPTKFVQANLSIFCNTSKHCFYLCRLALLVLAVFRYSPDCRQRGVGFPSSHLSPLSPPLRFLRQVDWLPGENWRSRQEQGQDEASQADSLGEGPVSSLPSSPPSSSSRGVPDGRFRDGRLLYINE